MRRGNGRGIGLACLALLGAAVAQGAAVSEADIQHWLAVWQKREGLEERTINLRFVHQREVGRGGMADVEWWRTPGTASIRFIYPEELETVFGDTPAKAWEEAQRGVIHELMHLVIAGLYDDGSGRGSGWLAANPARLARMEAITDNLARMLLRRGALGGVAVVRYISRQINGGPWNPAPDVRQRVMLQVVRAMNAAAEDDVMVLFARR
jgi:hypothetical protein